MKKSVKKLAGAVCGVVMSASVFALSACGGSALYDGYGSEYFVNHEDGKEVTYTFEAEFTNVNNKAGTAFSGERVGTNMVVECDSSASGGYAIAGLCKNGLSVNFVIVCDRDVDDATLTVRCGNEEVLTVYTVTPETFQIRVDPVIEEDTYDYNGDPSGAWGNWDEDFLKVYDDENGYLPFAGYYIDEWECETIDFRATETQNPSGFEDYLITTTLKLKAGLNCISLITNNSDVPQNAGSNGSTLFATAPIVDCIKIKTTAQLGMFKPMQNQSYLNLNNACTFK